MFNTRRTSLITPETIFNGIITEYEYRHYSAPTVEKLSQKGITIAWLRAQGAEMTFSPNSKEQCVHGRMFRRVLGDHNFAVGFDTVDYLRVDDKPMTAPLAHWGARYQRHTLAYLEERDGYNEADDPRLDGQITRDEALALARALPGR